MSGGSESDDCVTANGRVYILEVRNEETPAVGMKFDLLDLVYNFYNRYAFLAGFGIRLHSSFWGGNKKEILRKEFVCCKQGEYRRDETRERKRQRGISRCNCKAKIVVVKTNGSKKYTISLFAEGHNHKMTPSERMHLLRSHRHSSDSTKVLTKQLGSVNILIHQKETTESFIWMFEEFKKAMPSGGPKTIITDQDAAMTRAISIPFPTTFHRLCILHITSKFSVKLPHSAYKEYWREFQKAVWDTDNKDKFVTKWNIVVTKAGLTDHPWLSSMFDLRESWVPAYAQQFFAAGMSSSQRVEGSHGFFKQYISRRNSLMDFIIRFERALSHQRQKETSPSNNDESTPIDRSDPLFYEFDTMHGPTE
ncbi:protein FAR1-RELATED SEQUENCE 5-like [Prunus persica]|uniref:protein FAR1-RELATED SEQUENCE 5-like n=1 Tax=Prunus persica TaxID=3760 RepID=UPI0009AB948A|nr:protein FAR1-RELATED SEQUENCE 5-like [Prunus persica]